MKNLKSLLVDLFNLEGELVPQHGYANKNFKLVTNTGDEFIVKLNDNISELGLIEAQGSLLDYLSKTLPDSVFPVPVLSKNRNSVEMVEIGGKKQILRLLTWLDGRLIKDVNPTEKLFEDIGITLAKLDKSLLGFVNPYIIQRVSDWDLQHALITSRDTEFIHTRENRRLVEYFFLQFETLVFKQLSYLRKSIIHADANDYNLLVKEERISGVIDFGDCVHSQTINELAIVLAYLLMDKDEPVYWAEHVVKGYHSILQLDVIEIELLYYLIAARLAMSVTKSAVSRHRHPENEYLLVSETAAWKLLWKWIEINPVSFTNRMKEACNVAFEDPVKEENILSSRRDHISASLSISYKQPISMVKAALQYMYSQDGLTYLDCVNNICHVGHIHPRVVRAGQKQMALLNTNTRYLYNILTRYGEKLASKFPAPLDTIFFVNSGSEAGDLAQRIARTITGQKNTVVVDHAYHGNTIAGIEVSPYKYDGKGGTGKTDHIFKMDIPDGYRGKYKYNDAEAGRKYASQIDVIMEDIRSRGEGISAFYCESIIGCGGQVILPEGYLKYIYDKVRKQGGVCIADEVQVGFGRVGEKFWGFELQDVVPDIVVLGKPMGNGHPMAAVITTRSIADQFNNGMEFFSSFGGNPVSCAIGLEVLKVIEEEGLQQNALETGTYFMSSLKELASESGSIIGDVRGFGLFIGVELVEDKSLLTPATDNAKLLVEEMKKRGILLSTDGPYNNVLKIKPPMVFNRSNSDRVVNELDQLLSKIK